jgi:hypothetical protein
MSSPARTALQALAAIAALVSAYCWVRSALVTFPAVGAVWAGSPPNDGHQLAVAVSAFWNFFGAAFAAVAAFIQALGLWISLRNQD